MPQIHVLDSETIDKIAAGEVVERPFSVVKELVENAIDAGADAITVEARDGGASLIRVTDNGSGIPGDQIRTAFLRHATSKIESAADLSRILSLGFRGEALSSIAAVSRLELITKCREALAGNRILLEGAVERSFEEVGAPEGTTLVVRNLFYNTPVRRKFLKQPATEGGYISDLMEHMALSRPDISFKLILGTQTRFHTSGNGDLKEVIYRIYGRETASELIPIREEQEGIRVSGYLGKPSLTRANRGREVYFLNGRYIRSNVLAKAIEEGYKEFLMQHKFPFCVLHIELDAQAVDVNVHPTKMDVRFQNPAAFSETFSAMVLEGLRNRELIPKVSPGSDREERKAEEAARQELCSIPTPEPFELRRSADFREQETGSLNAVQEAGAWGRQETGASSESAPEQYGAGEIFFDEAAEPKTVSVAVEAAPVDTRQTPAASPGEAPKMQDFLQETIKLDDFPHILTQENRPRLKLIGQVFDTYWLVQYEEELLIIDQHAAHEKVKYERLMKNFRQREILSQNLFPPLIISLTGQEESVLREHLEVFQGMGFEVEHFGDNEYALRSVPTELYGCSEKKVFLEVLDQLAEGVSRGGFQVIEERLASTACRAAVKGNNALSREEAHALLEELMVLENPYFCPHGRPTIISMSKGELERKFKRIV